MNNAFYYVIIEIAGQQLFLNTDDDLTDSFDYAWRFSSRTEAEAWMNTHPRKAGHVKIVRTY